MAHPDTFLEVDEALQDLAKDLDTIAKPARRFGGQRNQHAAMAQNASYGLAILTGKLQKAIDEAFAAGLSAGEFRADANAGVFTIQTNSDHTVEEAKTFTSQVVNGLAELGDPGRLVGIEWPPPANGPVHKTGALLPATVEQFAEAGGGDIERLLDSPVLAPPLRVGNTPRKVNSRVSPSWRAGLTHTQRARIVADAKRRRKAGEKWAPIAASHGISRATLARVIEDHAAAKAAA
jgi:hypothetical protein